MENEFTQITVDHARDREYDAAVGEFFVDPLPSIDFGRIAVQAARRAILTKAHDGRREWEYAEFKNRVDEVINARVKRVELGTVLVDLDDRAEGILRRFDGIPHEHFSSGDRVRAYIYDVREEVRRTADIPVAQPSAVHG